MNIAEEAFFIIFGVIGLYLFVWSGIVTDRFATRSHQKQSISKLDLRNTCMHLVRRTLILCAIVVIASIPPLIIDDLEFPPLLMSIVCMIVPLLAVLTWFAILLFNLRFAYKYKIVEESDNGSAQG